MVTALFRVIVFVAFVVNHGSIRTLVFVSVWGDIYLVTPFWFREKRYCIYSMFIGVVLHFHFEFGKSKWCCGEHLFHWNLNLFLWSDSLKRGLLSCKVPKFYVQTCFLYISTENRRILRKFSISENPDFVVCTCEFCLFFDLDKKFIRLIQHHPGKVANIDIIYVKLFCSTYLIRLVICVVYLRAEYSN